MPIVGAIVALALTLAIPFFINQALAFNARMSAYKNIQFRFKGSYGEAFMVLFVWPILGVLTLGILYPLSLLKINEYITRNHSYGTSRFDFNATYRDYAVIMLLSIVVVIVAGVVSAILSTLLAFINGALAGIAGLIVFAGYMVAIGYFFCASY